MPTPVFAAIFDLDGVLTSTSARHEQSWAEAAERFGIPVTDDALLATRSVPRASALSAILAHAGIELDADVRERLMAFKNVRFQELIENLQPGDAFAGAFEKVAGCRELGMKVGVASASLNAPLVLDRIGLAQRVDFVADPRKAEPKPSAEIYGMVCAALGALPGHAACIEDGAPMIANLRAEGLHTVGIGARALEADEQFAAIAEWDVRATLARLETRA
jgi:beta-phosphoglucomutase-like phosphatase (HAD superfamily)